MSVQAEEAGAPADATRSYVETWIRIFGLLKEFWLANPLAWLATMSLQVLGNARGALYVLGPAGVVGALVEGSYRGHSALFWIGVFIAGNALEEFYWTVYPVLQTYLSDHGFYRIQRRVLTRAAAAPLIQFEEGPFFDRLQRAQNNMGERLMKVWSEVAGLVLQLARLGSVAIVLFVVHPLLVPMLALGVLPTFWLQGRVADLRYAVDRSHTTRDRIRNHLEEVLTGQRAAQELRLFDTAGYLLDRWWHLRDSRRRDTLAAEQRRSLASLLGDIIAGVSFAAGLVFVVYLVLGDQLNVGDYVAMGGAAGWFHDGLSGIVYSLRGVHEQSRFVGDLFEFWKLAAEEPSEPHIVAQTATLQKRGVGVEASSLTFTYPTGDQPALRDVDLRIEGGEKVAIVGENGAGKTTLAKLLMGLYQPDSGVVRFDGIPLTPERAVAVRSRIAAVFQDYVRYELTLRENIGFGDRGRLYDDAALTEAAEKAGIGDLIDRMTDGLEGFVGRSFGDTDISGGQWQKLALARAFFRDADLLVLDEPTATLDPRAELALFERFVELARGRTAIMISHRLGVARLADRVIVLRKGKVVEEGRHDEMVKAGGEYADLFAAQAQWYR